MIRVPITQIIKKMFCILTFFRFVPFLPFLEISKTQWEIDETPWKTRIYAVCFCQYFETYTIFMKRFFFFFQIHFHFFCDFSTVFRRFLLEFAIFVEAGFSAEIPTIRDRIYANNSALSVESITLTTIIDAKMGQHGRR